MSCWFSGGKGRVYKFPLQFGVFKKGTSVGGQGTENGTRLPAEGVEKNIEI